MKRFRLSILLTLLLTSCSNGASSSAEPSSSSSSVTPPETGETYIRALGEANKKSCDAEAIRLSTDNTLLKGQIQTTSDGEPANLDFRIDKFVIDAKIDGLQATDPAAVRASVNTYMGSISSTFYASGFDFDAAVTALVDPSKGFALKIGSYIDQDACYLDLSSAAAFRIILNTLVFPLFNDPDFTRWSARSKFSFSDGERDWLNGKLPLSNYLSEVSDDMTNRMLSVYRKNEGLFTFDQEEGVTTIAFDAGSWHQLIDIVESFIPEQFGVNLDKVADKLTEWTSVNACKVAMSFSEEGLSTISYDFRAEFKEGVGSDSIKPVGEWCFSGDLSISSGEDASVNPMKDKEKKLYVETSFPTYHPSSK